MKYDVFISYSRKDFDEVNALIYRIKECLPQLDLWFDITGIESGEEFQDKIISAIDNSSYILFAISDNSLASTWTKDEVMYAKNTNKKIIPILLKNGGLKGWFLLTFGRIDCIDSTNELQFNKLVNNLSKWTNNTGTSDFNYGISDELKNTIKLAELGVPNAQYDLGLSYFSNRDFESSGNFIKDYKQAAKWYAKAAEQGHIDAQVQLGICYANGLGVDKNEDKAYYWWQKAAEQGHEEAISWIKQRESSLIIKQCLKGAIPPKDAKDALSLIKSKNICKLILRSATPNLLVIKAIKDVLQIGLMEAKNIVVNTPAIIHEGNRWDLIGIRKKIENLIPDKQDIVLDIKETQD